MLESVILIFKKPLLSLVLFPEVGTNELLRLPFGIMAEYNEVSLSFLI